MLLNVQLISRKNYCQSCIFFTPGFIRKVKIGFYFNQVNNHAHFLKNISILEQKFIFRHQLRLGLAEKVEVFIFLKFSTKMRLNNITQTKVQACDVMSLITSRAQTTKTKRALSLGVTSIFFSQKFAQMLVFYRNHWKFQIDTWGLGRQLWPIIFSWAGSSFGRSHAHTKNIFPVLFFPGDGLWSILNTF